jgi:hypothetical protein
MLERHDVRLKRLLRQRGRLPAEASPDQSSEGDEFLDDFGHEVLPPLHVLS